jgi:hypothetical protein
VRSFNVPFSLSTAVVSEAHRQEQQERSYNRLREFCVCHASISEMSLFCELQACARGDRSVSVSHFDLSMLATEPS